MSISSYILDQTNYVQRSVLNVLKLLEEGATIPFISRYRKEMTGGLDEVALAEIVKLRTAFNDLVKRKETILKAIGEQGLLTSELKKKIESTMVMIDLEDLYLPFKRKKKTKAGVAREQGLEPLAQTIMAQQVRDLRQVAKTFLKDKIKTIDDALEGARHIIAEVINEDNYIRDKLRYVFKRKATISSKMIKKMADTEEAKKYRQYEDWSEALNKCPSHRLLAMLRAENESIVRVKVAIDKEEALNIIDRAVIRSQNKACVDQLTIAIDDSWKRLLSPALSNETLSQAKAKADDDAIKVFAGNLQQLLLAPPLGEKKILALDPGFKSGCKLVCLDEKGDLLTNDNIYPHPPQREVGAAKEKVERYVSKFQIDAIAIGNGTASRETESFIRSCDLSEEVEVFVVNEAGASIYSASKIAREEFSNYDVTVRGAVSIGRRLADPLAELVKIDAKSIGVGQYQHDVDQTKLKNELDTVVISCVNRIGVNVNTASPSLLKYVSGIGEKLAHGIVEFRNLTGGINSRKELNNVPRLGSKAYEQSAAFLRISNGTNPLDNSSIHPERYTLVKRMAKDLGVIVEELIGNKTLVQKIDLPKYISDGVGIPTLTDIAKELEKPGIDPRGSSKSFAFDPSVRTINDVRTGMKLPGIINNITNFGCFVDIGIKENGLVHVSKLANRFISDVNQVVKLQQVVEVTVLEVDLDRKRIQLSLID